MWAKKFDRCIDCGTTDRKHYGRGRCWLCYTRETRRLNPEPHRASSRTYYAQHREEVRLKNNDYYHTHRAERRSVHQQWEDEHIFGGLRQAVLERDGHKCTKCGSAKQLLVHHVDGKGRAARKHERKNTLDNLVTLCRACHVREHKPRKGTGKGRAIPASKAAATLSGRRLSL